MPVYKYKTFEAASKHLEKMTSEDPLKRLSELQYMVDALIGENEKISRGVFRFKTMEQANKRDSRRNPRWPLGSRGLMR